MNDYDELKKAVQSGNFNKALSNLTPEQRSQVQKLLSDEEKAKKILSSPQAQALIRRLSKNE